MTYYIGQALGLVVTAGAILTMQIKNKKPMLIVSAIVNVLSALNILLLDKFSSGVIICIVAVFQIIDSLWHDKKGTEVTLAEKIISNSSARFAGLINHMYRLGEYGNRVIISGGLAMHSETMNNMIVKNLDPNINIEFQTLPPLFGAMRVCTELEYGKLNFDAFKNNFTYSYSKFN
jgi:hypothetical protein